MLWADVALKTGEMLVSSSSVIQVRTGRMARHGLHPSPADLREMQLMGDEKMAAASESGAAMANQLNTTHHALLNRAVQQWLGSANALLALATSLTPAQALARGQAFVHTATRAAGTATQLSSASARIAQRGLKPIHAKATANARRLARPDAS